MPGNSEDKSILIIHGWSKPVSEGHPLFKLLSDLGYEILSPNLFTFKFDEIEQKLFELCTGKDIYAIIGISMGGFILPGIALKFPNAKLVFLATGAKFAPRSKFVALLVRLVARFRVPVFVYKLFAKSPGVLLKLKREYDSNFEDMCKNFESMSQISLDKHVEAARFILTANTTTLLSNIRNRSLVISGKNDIFMPESEGRMLNKYLRNSRLILTRGTHYDVLDKIALDVISEFLGETG